MKKDLPPLLTIEDLKKLLNGFEHGIAVLHAARDYVDEVIACIEEAGGITVRARDTLKTSQGYEGHKARLEELEIRYTGALSKIDQIVSRANTRGVNLLKGETLKIPFDPRGQSMLETAGIDLSIKALEFRKPEFKTIEAVQDNRIDVMNAIDIATTLRHLITSDLFLLQGREEFSRETLDSIPQNAEHQNPLLQEEGANLLALQVRQHLSETDEPLAGEAQRDLLKQF